NFALSYFVPPTFVNTQWKAHIILGVFCAAMAVQIFFLLPETAGKILQDIEETLIEGIPAWKIKAN
ncbi:uncharacterized protein M421DRAFT_29456, partial [Didymella exigua CBS 183.55]